jgi:hypothetical protein
MSTASVNDLAIGMAFAFAVTAAISSVLTELIARSLWFTRRVSVAGPPRVARRRGQVDQPQNRGQRLRKVRDLMAKGPPPLLLSPARPDPQPKASEPVSATGMLLGSPIAGCQGIRWTMISWDLTTRRISERSDRHCLRGAWATLPACVGGCPLISRPVVC